MPSIWRIISNIVLIIVFIALAVYSLAEYRGDNININTNDDKLPLAKMTFTNLSYLVSYLEKMPSIRLLPIVVNSLEYQEQVLNKIDTKTVESLINKSNITAELPILKSETKDNIKTEFSLKNLGQRLKERLSKNWFQP